MENKFFSGVVKTLNVMAWVVLGVLTIGGVIGYVTDHQISVVHNENPPTISAAPVDMPTADNKSGG